MAGTARLTAVLVVNMYRLGAVCSFEEFVEVAFASCMAEDPEDSKCLTCVGSTESSRFAQGVFHWELIE